MFELLFLAIFASSVCTAIRASRLEGTSNQLALPRGFLDDLKLLQGNTPSLQNSAHNGVFLQTRRQDIVEWTLVKRASKKASGLPHGKFICNHQKPKRDPRGGFRSLHVTDDAFFYAAARVAGTLATHAALSRFSLVPGFEDPTQMAATVGLHAIASGMMAPNVFNASKNLLDKAQRCIKPLCQALRFDRDESASLSSASLSTASPTQRGSVTGKEIQSPTTNLAGRQSRSRYAQKALKQKSKAMAKNR